MHNNQGDNDNSRQFFGDEKLDEDQLFVEVPAEQKSPYQERIESGYDPMGQIYLRGRTYRSLAGGRIRWWVLISGWIVFGGIALLLLTVTIVSGSLAFLLPLVLATIPIWIVLRGTLAKLSSTQRTRR
jgi:hypothetical protein